MIVIEIKNSELKINDSLTNLIGSLAKETLASAIEGELKDFLAKHATLAKSN